MMFRPFAPMATRRVLILLAALVGVLVYLAGSAGTMNVAAQSSDVPTAPLNVALVTKGQDVDDNVSVSWDPPSSIGSGPITEYYFGIL